MPAAARPSRRGFTLGFAAILLPCSVRQHSAAAAPAAETGLRELVAAPAEMRLSADGDPAKLWLFNGELGGALLRIRHGDELAVRFINRTPSPLSLHWHGVRAPNGNDGVAGLTGPPVAPGGEIVCRFVPPDPGTYLFRSLVPGGASEAAGRGLAGILVVEESSAPLVDSEYVLLVRDWKIQPAGDLQAFGSRDEAALAGRLGNRIDVAGVWAPHRLKATPGSRLRLRLVNGCNARIVRMRFDGMRAAVIAVDGQPAEAFQPLRDTLPFAPGTRYDIVVDVPNQNGAESVVSAQIGPGVPLLAITAAGEPRSGGERAAPALAPNGTLPAEIKLQNALRRDIVLAGGATRGPTGEIVMPPATGPVWTMNGTAGSPSAAPLFKAQRGQAIVLGIENRTGFPQPLHLHGHVFRLLHSLDDGWEPYWLDTFQVPEGKTLHIAFIADNPGRWALSSTVLERFDAGLWAWFEVG